MSDDKERGRGASEENGLDGEPDWEAIERNALLMERWERDRIVSKAAQLGVELLDERDPVAYRGVHLVYRSAIPDRRLAIISRYPNDWRIQEELLTDRLFGRSWRYPRMAFDQMAQALAVWDCDPDGEPTGWTTRILPGSEFFKFAKTFVTTPLLTWTPEPEQN